MSARWKRNTVVATMVLLVCAAVALNWKYTGEQAADAVKEAVKDDGCGDVLVFMPGVYEIRKTAELLAGRPWMGGRDVFPL